METLAACAPVYGASVFLPLIDEVFDALKVEVSISTRRPTWHILLNKSEGISFYRSCS